jgi:hypothetical protein
MFREIPNVTQHPDTPGYRRWFRDTGWDLIVWYASDDHIRGFQLCHDTLGPEHAVTWHEGSRLTHNRVDTGEGSPMHDLSPVLVPGEIAPSTRILDGFSARAATLETEIVRAVRIQLATLRG